MKANKKKNGWKKKIEIYFSMFGTVNEDYLSSPNAYKEGNNMLVKSDRISLYLRIVILNLKNNLYNHHSFGKSRFISMTLLLIVVHMILCLPTIILGRCHQHCARQLRRHHLF